MHEFIHFFIQSLKYSQEHKESYTYIQQEKFIARFIQENLQSQGRSQGQGKGSSSGH